VLIREAEHEVKMCESGQRPAKSRWRLVMLLLLCNPSASANEGELLSKTFLGPFLTLFSGSFALLRVLRRRTQTDRPVRAEKLPLGHGGQVPEEVRGDVRHLHLHLLQLRVSRIHSLPFATTTLNYKEHASLPCLLAMLACHACLLAGWLAVSRGSALAGRSFESRRP